MKFGVVVFPGSNCDEDIIYTLQHTLEQEVVKLWHKDTDLQGAEWITSAREPLPVFRRLWKR
jgi:phosphoribosylformylglycinamidine synthase subunit PurQ / glutaminase